MSGEPFPKSLQLARGPRRYRRHVAPAKEWEWIWNAKRGPCRVCRSRELVDPHHIVFRGHGGDDYAENIAPLCRADHEAIHRRAEPIARLFLAAMTDAEYAYMVERGGEDYAERVYGIRYTR